MPKYIDLHLAMLTLIALSGLRSSFFILIWFLAIRMGLIFRPFKAMLVFVAHSEIWSVS